MLRNLNQSPVEGKRILGTPRSGVPGSAIPSTGQHGPSFLYPSLSLPADAGREIRGWIVSRPAAGILTTFENGSYEYDLQGASGTQAFTFQLYVNGLATGAPAQVSFDIAAATPLATNTLLATNTVQDSPKSAPLAPEAPAALLPAGYPLPADVREGVQYGPEGELVGTLVVP